MLESDRWDKVDGTIIMEFPLQPNDKKLIDELVMRIEKAGYRFIAREETQGGMRVKFRLFYAGEIHRQEFLVVVESPIPVSEEMIKSHIYHRYEAMKPSVTASLVKPPTGE